MRHRTHLAGNSKIPSEHFPSQVIMCVVHPCVFVRTCISSHQLSRETEVASFFCTWSNEVEVEKISPAPATAREADDVSVADPLGQKGLIQFHLAGTSTNICPFQRKTPINHQLSSRTPSSAQLSPLSLSLSQHPSPTHLQTVPLPTRPSPQSTHLS